MSDTVVAALIGLVVGVLPFVCRVPADGRYVLRDAADE
jgi:hypothetical protein